MRGKRPTARTIRTGVSRMAATDSPSSSEPGLLTKIEIKCMIRRLMSHRLIRNIYRLAQNALKRPFQRVGIGQSIFTPRVPLSLLFLSTSSRSRSLFEWEETEQEDGTEPDENDEDEHETRAAIYARVSSHKQAKEGHSIETQIDNLEDFADNNDIRVVKTLQDEGETGTDFTRAGIRKAFELASNGQIDTILVDDISRVGRHAPQTIYFIYVLEEEIGVTVQTPMKLISLTSVQDLISTTMDALMAHIETKEQGRKSKNSSVRLFLKEKKWTTWYQVPPLGYVVNDDDWLSQDPAEVDVIEEIFTQFLETESYAETQRRVNAKFEDQFEKGIRYNKIRDILSDTVYAGRPSIPINPENYTVDENFVSCPELQLIDDDLFDDVQNLREKIKEENTYDTDPISVDDIVDEFGLFPAAEGTPKLKPQCPACFSRMRRNGTKTLETTESSLLERNLKVQNYECTHDECGYQYRLPTLQDYDLMSYLKSGIKSYFPDFEL